MEIREVSISEVRISEVSIGNVGIIIWEWLYEGGGSGDYIGAVVECFNRSAFGIFNELVALKA